MSDDNDGIYTSKAHQEFIALLMKKRLEELVEHPKQYRPSLSLTLDLYKPKAN